MNARGMGPHFSADFFNLRIITIRAVKKREQRIWERQHMVSREDLNGEALVWSIKCSVHARCRLGPKLMNYRAEERHESVRRNVENIPQVRTRRCD